MKFSITIPAYKKRFLREAIESVTAQTWPEWELIIVDDCSPDDLLAVVRPFLDDQRISYRRNEVNCGAVNVVDNWNHCLDLCSSEYVICMGDDDRLLPGCLSAYIHLMELRPGLDVYHTRTELIDSGGNRIDIQEERPEWESALSLIYHRWATRNKQYIGDFCFSTPFLKAAGGYYRLPLAWGSDDITAALAAREHGVANTQEFGFQYRVSDMTISNAKTHALVKMDATMRMHDFFDGLLAELAQGTLSAGDEELLRNIDAVKHSFFLKSLGKNVIDHVAGNPFRLAACHRKLKPMHYSVGTWMRWYLSSLYHRMRKMRD